MKTKTCKLWSLIDGLLVWLMAGIIVPVSAQLSSDGLGGVTARYDLSPITSAQPEARIEEGEVWLHIDAKRDKELWEDNGISEVEEDIDTQVSGLSGRCVKVYFTNWGQAVNPLLYMLMDNGCVEMLDLNTSLRWLNSEDIIGGAFISGGPIPGVKDVVALEEEVSEDETLVTVVGKTKEGKAYPLETYFGPDVFHRYYKEGAVARHTYFVLTPDWRMVYIDKEADGSVNPEGICFTASFQCPGYTPWDKKFSVSYGSVFPFFNEFADFSDLEGVIRPAEERTYDCQFTVEEVNDDDFMIQHIEAPFDADKSALRFSIRDVNPF